MNTCSLQINYPCKFHLGDEKNAWQAWFDDSEWEEVFLPHDWSVHMPFSKDYSSGTGYLAGGIGWYRIHISPKEEWKGKRVSITFDGVYKNSRVWCNSYYLGERPNGYISFTYDLTDFFNYEGENIISVYVDRREIADSRWFTGSGIIGKVSVNITEPIALANYGLFFTSPDVSEAFAVWETETKWINKTEEDTKVNITYELIDEDGSVASKVNSNITAVKDQETVDKVKGDLALPKLWSPASPNLYTLRVTAKTDKDEYIVATEKVGIRTFNFDPDKGFTLNGMPEVFKGVCLHHDAGVLGAAVPPGVWYQRLCKLKEMGCNAIRMSHNPHVPELYSLCDSLGFMVMDEAFDEWEGPKNKWSTGHNVYPPKHEGYYVNFNTWGKTDLTDMILRDRNHPSVIMWSTGNEIDYPNDPYCNELFKEATGNNDANKPLEERLYNPLRPDAKRLKYLANMLTEVVKETDTTHPVTLAASFPELSAGIGFIDSLDVVGYNYRENLYEEHHKLYPDKPFLGSENGHGISQWRAVTDHEFISGQFLWTGIDYLGEAHGWPIRGSQAGLLTIAGLEKTGFYRRQSFWSEAPMVHIATVPESESCISSWGQEFEDAYACEYSKAMESWNYKAGERITVKCYTNAERVELFINDRLIDSLVKDRNRDCVIFNVDYEAGELKAKAYNGSEKVAEDAVISTKEAAEVNITKIDMPADRLPLINAFDADKADAFNDLSMFKVTLLDRDARRVRNADRELTVTVENGHLLGVESGDLSDVTPYTSVTRKTYLGELVAYAVPFKKGDKVEIKVRG